MASNAVPDSDLPPSIVPADDMPDGTSSAGSKNDASHYAGISSRALLNGIQNLGDLPESALKSADALGTYLHNKLLGTNLKSVAEEDKTPPVLPNVADALGLDKPTTGPQRVVSAALQGAPGALLAPEAAIPAALAGATGGAASQVAAEAGASPTTQALVGVGAGAAPGLAAAGLKGGLQAALQIDPKVAAQNADLAASAGVTNPSIGRLAGPGTNAQTVESALTAMPGSAGVMRANMERANQQAASQIQDIASNLGATASASSPENVGARVQSGLTDSWLPGQKAIVKQAYAKRDALIPSDATVDVAGTYAAIKKQAAESPTFAAFIRSDPEYQAFLSAVEKTTGAQRVMVGGKEMYMTQGPNGTPQFSSTPPPLPSSIRIPYKDAAIAQNGFNGHVDYSFLQGNTTARINGSLSQVAKALSGDVADTVSQYPAAKAAGQTADAIYKGFSADKERLKSVMNALTPEQAYDKLINHAESGATVLGTAMRGLSPDDQRLFTGSVLRQLGVASPGTQNAAGSQWSANTFLTNWNKLPENTKTVLFKGLPQDVSDNLTKFAQYAENVKNSQAVYANPSGTASKSALIGAGGQFGGAIAALGLGHPLVAAAALSPIVASFGSAKLMTNPTVVRWLAASTKLPTSSLPVIATQLARYAQQTNDPEIQAFATQVQGAAAQSSQ